MFKILLVSLFSVSAIAEVPSFSPFQKILDRHLVKDNTTNSFETFFDYTQAYSDSKTLKAVAQQKKILMSFQPEKILNKNEALAFWINSYNFFMITKIFDKGFKKNKLKINSVKDLGSLFNPYAAFNDKFANIGGQKMSLDDIEKGWLLGSKGDTRTSTRIRIGKMLVSILLSTVLL